MVNVDTLWHDTSTNSTAAAAVTQHGLRPVQGMVVHRNSVRPSASASRHHCDTIAGIFVVAATCNPNNTDTHVRSLRTVSMPAATVIVKQTGYTHAGRIYFADSMFRIRERGVTA